MEFGAITGYVDLAQIVLYAFWVFFAGLIFYLVRENHREGYPMESDSLGRAVIKGWPIPEPKTFKLLHGGEVTVPQLDKPEMKAAGRVMSPSPGSPLEPTGNPMTNPVGPGSYANRADTPDLTYDGHVRILPLRAAPGYGVASNDPDPRGLTVIGADGKSGGIVRDLWVDTPDSLFRYLEVETPVQGGTRRVLLPVPFARIRRSQVEVNSIYGHQFAQVPGTRNPDQVTLLEEDKISAYYGAGTLYADAKRAEPWM